MMPQDIARAAPDNIWEVIGTVLTIILSWWGGRKTAKKK